MVSSRLRRNSENPTNEERRASIEKFLIPIPYGDTVTVKCEACGTPLGICFVADLAPEIPLRIFDVRLGHFDTATVLKAVGFPVLTCSKCGKVYGPARVKKKLKED